LFEFFVEKLLKRFQGFAKLINHVSLLIYELAFSSNTTHKETSFSLYCQWFIALYLSVSEFSVYNIMTHLDHFCNSKTRRVFMVQCT
jgi:hypothetical protein